MLTSFDCESPHPGESPGESLAICDRKTCEHWGDMRACKTKLQHLGGPLVVGCSIGQTLPSVHISSGLRVKVKSDEFNCLL